MKDATMAHTTYTHTTPAARPIRDRLAERFTGWRADFTRWREYRRTIDELQSLSDRDLADLGVHRGDIRRIAYESSHGTHTR